MTNPFKPKPASLLTPPRDIRDTLFADAPLQQWPPDGAPAGDMQPWKSFVDARDAIANGRTAEAIAAWQAVTQMPQLESRHYAQAWYFLAAHGVQAPADKAKQLLGVILEVATNDGLDLLAAYPERTARYYNFSGAGVVWEHPDPSLDSYIDALLTAGQTVLNTIGPWDKPRLPAPSRGNIRLNVLSPAGLHFGQGPFDTLAEDPLAKPVITAGIALMQQLIARGSGPRIK